MFEIGFILWLLCVWRGRGGGGGGWGGGGGGGGGGVV